MGVALSLHGLGMIELHSSARIHLFRSNRMRASLAGLTDRLSLVEFIPRPPSCTALQECSSWSYYDHEQWNFTMSPLLHILWASVLMCNVSKWFGSSKPGAAVQECTVTTLMSTQGMWVRVDVVAELYIKSLIWWDGVSPWIIAFYHTHSYQLIRVYRGVYPCFYPASDKRLNQWRSFYSK